MNAWKVWIHGAIATAISGIATVASVKLAAPELFDWEKGWETIVKIAAVQAALNVAAYLKQSPIPSVGDDAKTTTPKTNLLLIGALLVVGCVGCASVPKTRISFNPVTKEIVIQSPKDVELTNLSATINKDGGALILVGTYTSKNNAEVINAVATQNANTWKAISDLTSKLADTAITATGKAAKP